MTYESWRISFQSSEQAARAAYAEAEALRAEVDALLEACCLAARYLNPDQFPDAVKKIDAAIAAANGDAR